MIAVLWLVYDLAIALVVTCVLVPAKLVGIALGRSRWRDLEQRLGRPSAADHLPERCILVHAVSAGEMAAASSLVPAVLEQRPDTRFVITAGNRHGRDAAERLFSRTPAVGAIRLLPWDRRRAVRRWLRALAPDAVVVVETEIWPNLFRVCRELDIPLFVVNGRVYPGDVPRYRLVRGFFADVLAAVDWIGALDGAAAEAFRRIGAHPDRIDVVGDLKFDRPLEGLPIPEPWRSVLGGPSRGPLIAAASTHRPEEAVLLDAIVSLRPRFPRVRLVLAPRHPERCAGVARLAASRGLAAARWSRPETAAAGWDVLLVDGIGSLAAVFGYADIAFIGGSLAPRGGHNPLEAAACGCPIVMGPSTDHFRGIVDEMAAAGALIVLPPGRAAVPQLTDDLAILLADRRSREEMGRRALAYLAERRGVARRYAGALLAREHVRTADRQPSATVEGAGRQRGRSK